MIQKPKGTKDILPDEVYKWQYIEKKITELMTNYGMKEIRVPVFEHTELFSRGVGETTDVVQKEMYTFIDRICLQRKIFIKFEIFIIFSIKSF